MGSRCAQCADSGHALEREDRGVRSPGEGMSEGQLVLVLVLVLVCRCLISVGVVNRALDHLNRSLPQRNQRRPIMQ